MRRRTRNIVGTVVVLSALNVVVEAQQREIAKPQAPATTTATPKSSGETSQSTNANLEGCVFPKRALTEKRQVTLAADSVEDFVLTNTHVIAVPAGTQVAENSVFKLDQVEQPRLRQLIGLGVRVNGKIEKGPDLRVLRVTSIIETVGSCPAVPTPQP